MKKLSCSVWCAIAALIVGSFCCRTIADDTNDTKHTSDSRHTLEFRSYPIQPGVFKTLVDIPEPASQGTVSRLKQTNAITSDKEIQKFFVGAGVPFPEGSFVTYSEKLGLLVVRNSRENLDLLDRVMGAGSSIGPQVTIEARFLQMPRTLAEDLFVDDEGLSRACIIKEKILKRIDDLARHGKITELARPKLTTVCGNTAQVKAVKEYRYPTEFGQPVPPSTFTNVGAVSVTPCVPSGFETRELGYLLNATPTLGPDGSTINITLVPEVSRLSPQKRQFTAMTPFGKVTAEQPEFISYQTTTTVILKSGQTMLLSVMDPVAEDGKLTQNDVVFVLLSATVIRE